MRMSTSDAAMAPMDFTLVHGNIRAGAAGRVRTFRVAESLKELPACPTPVSTRVTSNTTYCGAEQQTVHSPNHNGTTFAERTKDSVLTPTSVAFAFIYRSGEINGIRSFRSG